MYSSNWTRQLSTI